jgi:CheY-like chemotaxis protein
MGERYSEQSEAGAASPPGLRLLCAIERPDTLALVRETLRSALPSSTIEFASAVLPAGRLPEADCVILDAHLGGTPGIEAARALRAAGYEGGIVLLESAVEADAGRSLDPEERIAVRAAARTSGPVSMRLAAIGVPAGSVGANDAAGRVIATVTKPAKSAICIDRNVMTYPFGLEEQVRLKDQLIDLPSRHNACGTARAALGDSLNSPQ